MILTKCLFKRTPRPAVSSYPITGINKNVFCAVWIDVLVNIRLERINYSEISKRNSRSLGSHTSSVWIWISEETRSRFFAMTTLTIFLSSRYPPVWNEGRGYGVLATGWWRCLSKIDLHYMNDLFSHQRQECYCWTRLWMLQMSSREQRRINQIYFDISVMSQYDEMLTGRETEYQSKLPGNVVNVNDWRLNHTMFLTYKSE